MAGIGHSRGYFISLSLIKYLTPLTSTRPGRFADSVGARFDSHSNTKILKPKCIHIWVKVFYVPEVGIEPYRFSTPIGYIFSQAQNIAQSGFDFHYQNKKPGARPDFLFRCPRWESNPHPLRDTILSRARIPIPPLGQMKNILRIFLNSICPRVGHLLSVGLNIKVLCFIHSG